GLLLSGQCRAVHPFPDPLGLSVRQTNPSFSPIECFSDELLTWYSMEQCEQIQVCSSLSAVLSALTPALLLSRDEVETVSETLLSLHFHKEAVTRTVKKWSKETEEALKDCFKSTVWEELSDPNGEDTDSLTHCITDYVNFCVENTVPTKTIQCLSNNKPWINPDIKALLKEEKRVFRSGDKDELKAVQRDLRRKIREGKASYRRKLEEQLQRNNVSGVWKGLKTISGHKKPDSQVVGDLPLPLHRRPC
ncbi:hypothetical protein NFI96_032641, partial [Prochilodus magdalenae]